MKCKKMIVWSLLNERPHHALTKKERQISGSMGVISALFPGINYFSMTGFHEVMRTCVIPVLKKRFEELSKVPEELVDNRETIDLESFLPSKGYEWQDSARWRVRFEDLLEAA